MRERGSNGGKATLLKYGNNHFVKIGKKGGAISKQRRAWRNAPVRIKHTERYLELE